MNKIVLVTRPLQQSTSFINALEDKGYSAIAFPCIEIQSIALSDNLKERINNLNNYELIIFISANAVEKANSVMQQLGIKPESITAKIATIGKATSATANKLGFKVSLSPCDGFNSESLLSLEALQSENIKQKSCIIFRGIGGLEYLADELKRRGAIVSYAEVYQRIKPHVDKEISRQKLSKNWQDLNIDVVTITSNEALQNLYDMLESPGKEAMLNTLLIVASVRMLDKAKSLGFKLSKCAKSAMNEHMLDAINMNL